MGSLSRHHEELTDGVGKCSVPMWINGCPAGFCDAPAYGHRPEGEEWTDRFGRRHRLDGRYAGYVPALACPAHGGPEPEPLTDQEERERECAFSDQHGPDGCTQCGMEPLR